MNTRAAHRRSRHLGRILLGLCALAAATTAAAAAAAVAGKPLTSAEVLKASAPSDWRTLDPASTLYMQLPAGRVITELAPQFAPRHVANIAALARAHFFDGLAITRAQDNYVVQWGDAESHRPLGDAQRTVAAESSVRCAACHSPGCPTLTPMRPRSASSMTFRSQRTL